MRINSVFMQLRYSIKSVAALITPVRFKQLTIPHRSESMELLDPAVALKLPVSYRQALVDRLAEHSVLKEVISESVFVPSLTASGSDCPAAIAANGINLGSGVIVTTAITNEFIEWLVTTGKAQQILDLINLDGEKSVASKQAKHCDGTSYYV